MSCAWPKRSPCCAARPPRRSALRRRTILIVSSTRNCYSCHGLARVRALTLRARMWSDGPRVNPTAQKPSAVVLAQMFEPIREDLRLVEREFARHVQSQVAVIPAIGNYIQDSGGKRIRPAV